MKKMLVQHSSKAPVLGALSLMFLCTLAFVVVNIATSSGVDVAVDDGTSLDSGTSLSTSTPSGTLAAAPGPSPCQTEQDALTTARTNLINAQTALTQAQNDFYAVRDSYGPDTSEYLSAAASLQTANQQLMAAIQAVVTAVANVRSCHDSL